MSVGSWGIILYKLWAFRRSEAQSSSFLDVFRRSSKFSEVQAVCRSLTESPLVGLFQSGYAELTAQLRQGGQDDLDGSPRGSAARPTLKSLAAVDRALMRASVVEVNKLESRITFLATVASIAPFVGLFGTCKGIIAAFSDIATQGMGGPSVIAAGISEALVSTATGLLVAIPALMFYNYFSKAISNMALELESQAFQAYRDLRQQLSPVKK
ncbi:MAG: Tol-Pal system subunit TolQ [Verrucomicrobia bacterium]|nr:Tol-Pal system subunit TolQ [Verrucomicrobiota bacterium]